MRLIDYCKIVVERLGLGTSELFIARNGEEGYYFEGTFEEFLRQDHWSLGFVNSRILGVSTMLSTFTCEGGVYRTIVTI